MARQSNDGSRHMAQDGYTMPRSAPLTEGYVRKGGINAPSAQNQPRPAPPPPLRPSSGPNAPATPSNPGAPGTLPRTGS